MPVFAATAVVLTLLAIGLVLWPLLRPGVGNHPLAAVLTALGIPVAVLFSYLVASNYDWRATPATPGRTAEPAAGSVDEAVAALEQRLQAAPEDEEGWLLLGASYLSLNRAADALQAYQRALEVSGGRNINARLGVAEARIVLDPGSITGPVADEIEAVLKAEPRNPKGLWYGGLLGLARGQPDVARDRWRTLLELSPPERIRQIVEAQLAELDKAVGVAGPGTATAVTVAGASPEPRISVRVALGEAVRSRVVPSAPLFVFVRDSRSAGPPLAVIRRQAGQLPLELEIGQADIMMPGRTLAGLSEATVVARVAISGDPVAKPGDVYGEAVWQRDAAATGPLAIVIDRVVAP